MKFVDKIEDFNFYRIFYPEKIEEIGRLRVECWKASLTENAIDERILKNSLWIDEFDANAFHWIVQYKNILAAAARMSFHLEFKNMPWYYTMSDYNLNNLKFPIASINRLVVKPEFRRNGIAKKLDNLRIEMAKELGATAIVAQPAPNRIESLKKLGFKYFGKINRTKELPGVDFSLMILEL
ncbi:MAG: GNAT family N-acetyltransferase [Candidatus Kapabacteria bacterium]|nr:GNAT family N-acetyltransferase [Candidatus Kapabacteria bacterium]